MKARSSCQRGAAAVEFGLILPLLLAVVLGIMDYGYVYFVQLTMTNAAREGARKGAVADEATAAAEAEAAARAYMGSIASTVTTRLEHDAQLNARVVRVNVAIDPFSAPIRFVPTPSKLFATAAMRWELDQGSP